MNENLISHNTSLPSIDIIIVNWNSGSLLLSCIQSIIKYHANLVSSVIIVDNASIDSSLLAIDSLECLPFSLQVIRNQDNQGFGAACNQGANQSDSDFILFLNPDTRLFERSLSDPLSYIQDPNNQSVGIVGIQLLDEHSIVARSCARFPSPFGFLAHAIGLDKIFPSLGHFMTEWIHDSTRQVDQVIGAFFFLRRSLFEQLKGFDERFFVYYEEVDFSYRAKKVGWQTIYLADSQAFHSGGGTTNKVKARRLFYVLRSRLLYADKHFSPVGFSLIFLEALLLEPLSRSGLAVARHSWPALKETWQGYVMLWRWLPQWLFKGVTR